MTGRKLNDLLRGLDDTRAVVVSRGGDGDVLKEVLRAAQEEADLAYAAWQELHGHDAYLRYRAAADRADAALDALVAMTRD
jgi:hypothetical protein